MRILFESSRKQEVDSLVQRLLSTTEPAEQLGHILEAYDRDVDEKTLCLLLEAVLGLKRDVPWVRQVETKLRRQLEPEESYRVKVLEEVRRRVKWPELGKTGAERALEKAELIGVEELIGVWEADKPRDLYVIKGVAEQYSSLLREAGVHTSAELARSNPDNLYIILKETNEEMPLVHRLPSLGQVQDWVAQAKGLSGFLKD